MRSWSSSFCLALFLFIIRSIATQTCSQPRSANCCENNSTKQVDSSGYASVGKRNTAGGGHVYSVLESPWVNFSKPSCVEFTYFRGETPYQLQVFLAFNNDAQPRLVEDSDSVAINQNRTARFSIKPMTGKIQFRILGIGVRETTPRPKLYHVTVLEDSCVHQDGEPTTSVCTQSSVTTTSSTTRYPTNSEIKCPTLSTNGDIPSPDGESTAPPTHTSTQPTQISVTTTSSTLEPNPTMFSPDGDTPSTDAAAIAGVVVTVIVLIVVIIVVVIIVVIVCRRKRRQSKADNESRNTEDLSMSAGGTITGNTATERRGNPFSRRDGDYTDIDLATTPSSGINPYELADDATNTNGSLGPNLQRLNGSKEDDYSRIDEAQPAAAHNENSTPERPNPNDVYSVVNKPGKKTPTPVYSLAKTVDDKPTQPNPNDVYSVVNKKGKKFEPAAKPGQPDAEYNTISHNGNSSQTAPGGATPNTYNRISAVPSLGLNEKGRASTKPEDGLLTDDYNKLNLAGNGPVNEKSGAAGAAYDHVLNDPDDAYNKAGIGKRNVVIDSDYHRLKP